MIQTTTLDNGIRVISERIDGVHSVSLGVWVENGSRHESLAESGISHLIEHMLFKGTRRRSAQDIAREIDSVGGLLNAFTSREYSCYFAKVLGDKLPLALDLLSDIVLNSVIDPVELEKERNVILQEIHMVEDTPEDYVHDLFYQTLWKGHPLGLPVLGTAETVGSLEREELLSFLKRRYCGRSIVITAAGDLDHHEIAEAMQKAFGHVSSGDGPVLCSLPSYHRHVDVLEKDLEQAHICFGTQALPQNHPQRYEAFLINTILGSGMSSRLFQSIREERGLAYSIYSYLNCHSDAGALVTYAGCAPGLAPVVIELVLAEIRSLVKEPMPGDELDRAREQLKGNLLLAMESTDNRMTRLAKNEIYFGRQVDLDEVLAGFDRVTDVSLQAVAEDLFREDSLNIQVMGKVDASQCSAAALAL